MQAREAAVDGLRRKRQVILLLLLKHGRVLPGTEVIPWAVSWYPTFPIQGLGGSVPPKPRCMAGLGYAAIAATCLRHCISGWMRWP